MLRGSKAGCGAPEGLRSYSPLQGTDSSSGMGFLGRSGMDTGRPFTPHPMVIPQESFGKQLRVQPRIASQGKASQGMEEHDFVPQDGTWDRPVSPGVSLSYEETFCHHHTSTSSQYQHILGRLGGPRHWHDPIGVVQTLGMEPQTSSS